MINTFILNLIIESEFKKILGKIKSYLTNEFMDSYKVVDHMHVIYKL